MLYSFEYFIIWYAENTLLKKLQHKIPFFKIFILFLLCFPSRLVVAEVGVNSSSNYSVHYKVKVSKKEPLLPDVELQLLGADEVIDMTSLLDEGRYRHFRGDGNIKQIGSDVIWTPNALNAMLSYKVIILHERKPGVYDSYGKRNWVITRTGDLFPRKRFNFRKDAKSYTTVEFELPKGWDVYTEMPKIRDFTFVAKPQADKRYDWPTGWLIYGEVESKVAKFEDVKVRIAYPKAFVTPTQSKSVKRQRARQKYLEWFHKKTDQMVEIYEKVIPLMKKFMPQYAEQFLVIIGKDPMWQGGLSGERSLYINRGTPNIASDYTSTLVHEFFHVSDGFEKDKRDGEWIKEGLAEYYALKLLQKAEFITQEQFFEGIKIFKKNGIWGVNLARSKNQKVHYKNAPVVFFVLDQMIQKETHDLQSLDDVVKLLADEEKPIGTKVFRQKAEEVFGRSLKKFFQNYVIGGRVPNLKPYLKSTSQNKK